MTSSAVYPLSRSAPLFQVADKQTAIRNESGASSHEAYKARQHERVRMRLFRDKDDPLPPD